MVERVKRILKVFYTDSCNVFEKRVCEGVFTEFERVLKYSSVPCRMSGKNYLFGEKGASDGDNFLKLSKRVKLFLPAEYEVKPGSEIEVIRNGRRLLFGKSSVVHSYNSYNAVTVEIVKDYA